MTQRRWLARAAFALILAAVAVMIGFAGLASLAMVAIGAVGACLVLANGYWFLARRGLVRWLAFGVMILVPIAVLVVFALNHVIWVGVVSLVLVALAIAAWLALTPVAADPGMPAREVPPPKRAFLIMNPRSGGGKVAKFGLKEKAEALGAEVALLEGPGQVDVAALARKAVADEADLLGVAGGDGTQALVAGIAAEHDLPFLVISAGTRNHFAMDLGLDRENPATCLDALTDGVEQRIDLGVIGGRTFVNNASFGAYAEVVQSPAYRDDKRGTTLQPQFQVGPDRDSLGRGVAQGLCRLFGVPGRESDDHRHDEAPVIGQFPGEAPGAFVIAETETEAGFELVGLGEKDGVVALERRTGGGQ